MKKLLLVGWVIVLAAVKRWAFGPFCACRPARHAVGDRLAQTLGIKFRSPVAADAVRYRVVFL